MGEIPQIPTNEELFTIGNEDKETIRIVDRSEIAMPTAQTYV